MDNLTNNQIKERANLVFTQVSENIFKIHKDRQGKYSGIGYVNASVVLDSLNEDLRVALFSNNNVLIHKTF